MGTSERFERTEFARLLAKRQPCFARKIVYQDPASEGRLAEGQQASELRSLETFARNGRIHAERTINYWSPHYPLASEGNIMGNRLTDLSFEEWVDFFFAQPREKDRINRDYWDGSPGVRLAYITRAFENAGSIFAPMSDKRLAERLWDFGPQLINLHHSPSSKWARSGLPGADRARAIRSMLTLFQQVFAKRCANHLCHLEYGIRDDDDEDPHPLNGICYMWWDGTINPGAFEDDPCRDEIDAAILDVMEGTLALDSLACQESALHGLSDALGWQSHLTRNRKATSYPEGETQELSDAALRARAIIDAYLMRTPSPPAELREYAQAAWFGGVQ